MNSLSRRDKRGPIAWMAGHSVAANLMMLLCLAGGVVALWNMKQEVFPDLELDQVLIRVAYPGASPEEVESGIVLVVEEAVRGVDGVDEITSSAGESSGTVTVELLLGVDAEKVARDIQSEVDRITTFPEDSEEPQVSVASRRREVMNLVLYGDVKDTVLHELAERARDQLIQNANVTQVEVSGVPPLEISIEVSQENLRRYGLTLEGVAGRIRNASVDLPGGGIKTRGGEILVRVKERREYGREFGRLPIITTADGSEVLLEQIATIDDGFEETDRYSRYNGQRAVMLNVYRVGDQTPIQVSDAVRGMLADINANLPPGVKTSIERDRSNYYRQRVNLLLRNGAIGLALVLITLGLFLEARLAFWVMMGIPISFLASFLILPATGVTINMVTLFAYIIALGIVVDDAIVVGENVYHHHQDGLPFRKAAVRGAREVAMPVTFSILTNIVTFMPLYFIPGMMGKFFKMIPIVVCTVFLISLFESLFILPAHLAHQRDRKRRGIFAWLHNRQQGFSHGFKKWVRCVYGPFLAFSLRHRYVTIATAISVLLVAFAFPLSGRMGLKMFPKVESDVSEAQVILPYGSPVAKTEAVMQKLLTAAREVLAESGHPELVNGILTEVGRHGGHSGRMRVLLADPDVRDKIMSTNEFTNRWRKRVGEVPGVEYLKFASDSGGPGGHGRPVTVELTHRDTDVLAAASAELAVTLSGYGSVKDVDDGYQPGKEQLDFTILPEGKSLGLSARDIARQVRSAFYGAQVLRQQRGRNELKVMVRLPAEDRASEQTINDMMIRTQAGTFVPIRQVAAVRRGRAYTTIQRRNGSRIVQVSADVSPRGKAGEVLEDMKKEALPALLKKYPGLRYSFEGHQADMRKSMDSLMISFPLAMCAIYGLLAIPFRSYAQPMIVMVSIPFGIVGAIVGHLLMGYDLSMMSMFGIVALSGVVVNDSLVMIDFANRRRATGLSHREAIYDAAIQRFRPILLTTLTTFFGLAPMIFETSRQARFLIPMAISLGFGLVFATAITLVIVPSLYMMIEDAGRAARATRGFLFPTHVDSAEEVADTLE